MRFEARRGGWQSEGLRFWTMTGWDPRTHFDGTGLPWVAPSPNMPTLATARVYPGGCLIEGTALADPEVRKQLWDGGPNAIAASDDPMIMLARKVEPMARALRTRYDNDVEAPLEQASEQIAKARFTILSARSAPPSRRSSKAPTTTSESPSSPTSCSRWSSAPSSRCA